jgi:pSer/pThr/pTyr-binding forkhead associated (FHA) protein
VWLRRSHTTATMTAPASAAAAAASASSIPPDSRPGTGTGTTTGTGTASSLRRFGRLPSNSNSNSHSSSASPYLSSTHRPNRNPLASRFPRFAAASSNSPDLSSAGGSLPIPCAPTEQPSTISRYRQAFFGCYRDIGVDLQASSPESMVSVHSDDSEAEGDTQGTMARLRRQRTSSQTSQAPDPSHRPDAREPPRASSRSSSSRPRSSSNRPEASPVPPDPTPAVNTASPENTSTPENTSRPNKKATIRFYPHQDFHRNTRPSLHFIPVSRTLPSDNCVIRVGRYSERDGAPVANPAGPSGAPVGFKSKVVSRRHCEFLYINAQWHVKDVGSSSGTFLNHMRLSQPNMASRLYPIKDGDIVQLGIDFRGGEEMIFRCVRMRIECNRSWQQQPNEFKCVLHILPTLILPELTGNAVKIQRV